MVIKEIIRELKSRENEVFLVASHQNLEGDAIGSLLALAKLLERLGKKVIMLTQDPVPKNYMFLPDANKVRHRVNWKVVEYDVACIVDCTDLERLGDAKKALYLTKPIINIDHHVSNVNFGTINWVEPNFSCSGEQIFHIYKEMGVPIGPDVALYIYAAIITDTGSFRYSNTSPKVHEVCAELLKKGLNPAHIYRKIYEESHRSRIDLLAAALSTLDITRDGKVASVFVTKKMLKEHKADVEGTEDFVSFPRSIKGVEVALAFRQIGKNIIKVSLRSNNEKVDVSKLAAHFGGGGHPSASGCTLKGGINEVEEAVVSKTQDFIKRGRS